MGFSHWKRKKPKKRILPGPATQTPGLGLGYANACEATSHVIDVAFLLRVRRTRNSTHDHLDRASAMTAITSRSRILPCDIPRREAITDLLVPVVQDKTRSRSRKKNGNLTRAASAGGRPWPRQPLYRRSQDKHVAPHG